MREIIFNNRIPVSYQNESSPSTLKAEILRSGDKIEIRLINTKSLFSFYVSTISSGDFYMLKREQDIRVDFENFIKKLVEMFHYVSKGELIGVFQDEKFTFVERNEFRNIVRFELKFVKPEEIEYKRYLADVVSRLESDNVKLVRDNVQMKERIRSGDRENQSKIKILENDYCEAQRKIEKLFREIDRLEQISADKDDEIGKIRSEFKRIEKETLELRRELDKRRINDVKNEGLSLRLEEMERLNENLEKEIHVANGIIKKLKSENRNLKDKIESNEIEISDIKKYKLRSKKEIEELKRNNKAIEEKNIKLKENINFLENNLKSSESEKRALMKKLENAQNVYSHFYTKNNEEESAPHSEINSGISSIHPESPPR
ncbi:Spindle assembly abnormal protein 6 like protein [Dictyocoela muelleri]|nr:Spindle assembly abnormal protein 6 like protein [Dictyocoela muelleri]